MTDQKTARQARRRGQYRTLKVDSALSAFRHGAKDLGLSQRQYRAAVARIERASTPEREAQELLSAFMKACTRECGGDLAKALAMLDDCPEFRKRRTQRQDAIRRVVRAADREHAAALACAERIVNGDHWRGMTWLPEVKDGHIRPKARRREYVPAAAGGDADQLRGDAPLALAS